MRYMAWSQSAKYDTDNDHVSAKNYNLPLC